MAVEISHLNFSSLSPHIIFLLKQNLGMYFIFFSFSSYFFSCDINYAGREIVVIWQWKAEYKYHNMQAEVMLYARSRQHFGENSNNIFEKILSTKPKYKTGIIWDV